MGLDAGAVLLFTDAAFLGGARRFGCHPLLRHALSGTDQLDQARPCILAVLGLIAKATGLITSTPSAVKRRSRRASRRARSASGKAAEFTTSKRNSTALATLFMFCPPGPDARTKRSMSSASSICNWSWFHFKHAAILARWRCVHAAVRVCRRDVAGPSLSAHGSTGVS